MFNQFGFGGLKIIVSDLAVKDGARVKVYPKCKSKSASHWQRMDKKWRKRYGFKKEPCVYQLGDNLVVHPMLYDKLRRSDMRADA